MLRSRAIRAASAPAAGPAETRLSTTTTPPGVEQLAAELSGLGHPARLRLLHAFCCAEEIVLSPSPAAALLADLSLGVVSYHVRRARALLRADRASPRTSRSAQSDYELGETATVLRRYSDAVGMLGACLLSLAKPAASVVRDI